MVQQELIQEGGVRDRGGFAYVSDGEYMGCPIAIKRLCTRGGADVTFEVVLIYLSDHHRSAFN